MDASTLTATLVEALSTTGPLVLAVVVLLGTVGLPMPSTVLIVAAGALAREGVIAVPAALAATLVAAIVGDGAGYLLGRVSGSAAESRFGGKLWQQAAERFAQHGWMTVFLSRWLLTPIAVPVNVIAGMTKYRAHRFLSAEIAGDVTWVLLYATAGYLLGAQWQLASSLIGDHSGWMALAAAAGVIAWWGGKVARSRMQPAPILSA